MDDPFHSGCEQIDACRRVSVRWLQSQLRQKRVGITTRLPRQGGYTKTAGRIIGDDTRITVFPQPANQVRDEWLRNGSRWCGMQLEIAHIARDHKLTLEG